MRMKIVQFGLGPIGLETVRLATTKPWAEVIAAVDYAPDKAGRDLGQLTGIAALRGKRVLASLGALGRQKPDLVFHTSVSRFQAAFAQLEPLARMGVNVVSSCEEMLFPALQEPVLARKLDKLCRRTGARMVATGVNPGFVMDILPLSLIQVAREVEAIHVQRVVNASTRREPLQRKIGSGLGPDDFHRRFREGSLGHAGLKESAALVTHVLGWKLQRLVETGEPVLARHHIQTPYLSVKKGRTCGLHQRAEVMAAGKRRLTLDLRMYLDAENPHDAIQIDGEPALDVLVRGGVAGDGATVAALVNTAPRLLSVEPGLRLLTELPLHNRFA
jgi:2,4-diaminopentanoate dehydrogenase